MDLHLTMEAMLMSPFMTHSVSLGCILNFFCAGVQETTLFLQMLYNGWFKRQFTQELMLHYSDMVIDVAQKINDYGHHADFIRECKALDSTLDRGV